MLAACSSVTKTAKVVKKQPCWIGRPITTEYAGQVGVAQSRNNAGVKSEHNSRVRALAAAAKVLRFDGVIPKLQPDENAIMLGSHKIMFTDFIDREGLSYSLASWMGEPGNTEQCAPSQCDISNCNPSWLCQSHSGENASVLGVSYHAALPVDRYQRAIDNGLMQARLIHGSNIQSAVDIFSSSNSRTSQQVMYSSSHVEALNDNDLNHYAVTESCYIEGTILQHIVLYDVPKKYTGAMSAEWIRTPKLNGIDAAVGTVEKLTASGLFSAQLKLAVDRALVQLAQEVNVEVDVRSLYYQAQGDTLLVASSMHEKSQALLKAQILAFHFELLKNQQLRIYAWVMRVAD